MSVFTAIDPAHWVASNELAFAVRDRYPVSPGHTLVITRREVPTWFEATPAEQQAVMALVNDVKLDLDRDFAPAGYNVGFNAGLAAGQTVSHLHVHVIPRYSGDMDDPRGGVRHAIPGKGNYLAQRAPLATGGEADPFFRHIAPHFGSASTIDIVAAFVQESGVVRLLPALREALGRGATIRILTGDYLDITQAEGLARLLDLAQCGTDVDDAVIFEDGSGTTERAEREIDDGTHEKRSFYDVGALAPHEAAEAEQDAAPGTLALRVIEVARLKLRSFHPKSWRFEAPSYGIAWVGSSNLSAMALGAGVEWNLRVDRDRDPLAYRSVLEAFDGLWHQAREPDSMWLADYEARAARERIAIPDWDGGEPPSAPRVPHSVQEAALQALAEARGAQRTRALVVLATGLGKTLLAAFDFARMSAESPRPLRLLFVAHRRELLRQAAAAFRTVLAQAGAFPQIGFCVDSEHDFEAELVFASIATLARQRERLNGLRFDYVVFDEVHHAAAPSWRRVLDVLAPGFLLGLTATPDRADNADILGIFDDFIAFEAGIPPGIAQGLLAPFHYHGVRDTIDFANLPWRNRRWDPHALAVAAATEERMQTLWSAWAAYRGTRTLVFCCSITHALYVRDWLRARGVAAAAVFAADGSDDREASLAALEQGTLQALCAVDLFNEGVDLPALDRVVMLRPTESNVLFLQQLGRGLRRHARKESLTVLDFVGNHRVFERRLEVLLRTAAGAGAVPTLRELLVADGPLELAPGCFVDLELEAKNILRSLSARSSAVEDVYRELREQRGGRPRAGELQRMNLRPGTLRARYGSWFEFVAAEGDLTASESEALPALREFLREVETTVMTKCFKMVTLAVLAESGDPHAGLPAVEVANRSHAWLRRRPEFWADVLGAERVELVDDRTRAQWLSYWRRNPIAALTGGNSSLCSEQDGRLRLRCPLAPADTTAAMLLEIVDWRLAQYLARVTRLPGRDANVFRCKVMQSRGRPIAKLPNRAAYEIPEGDVEARLPDGRVWIFRFASQYINVAHPVDEDRNQLGQLVQAWFGPRAGQPGTAFEMEFSLHPDGWRVAPAA